MSINVIENVDKVVKQPKIGLALAGGGPEGAVWQIGALHAIQDAIVGIHLHKLPCYVSVSAGSFIGSLLANRMSTKLMVRSLVQTEPGKHPFDPRTFFTPAISEYLRSSLAMPKLFMDVINDYIGNRQDNSLLKSFTRLARGIPAGLFNNEPLRRYLEKSFSGSGRTNFFQDLKCELFIVATDLDSGEPVIFGSPGQDHVTISRAVQASTALPGLYPPVVINGRHFVDGVLIKTLHASIILETGIDLAICINPIVPVNTHSSVEEGYMRRGKLIDRGMPTVLSQTFRTMVHSRVDMGFKNYKHSYNADILLFEPGRDDYQVFFTNMFSYNARKEVVEHAYRSTMRNIKKRERELSAVLKRHGLKINQDVINNPFRDIWKSVGMPEEAKQQSLSAKLGGALSKIEDLIDGMDDSKNLKA